MRLRWSSVGSAWLLALLPSALPAGADPASPRGVRRALWIDLVELQPLLYQAMTAEVTSILAPTGVRLAWTQASPGSSSRAQDVRVVLMATPAGGAHEGRGLLGSARGDRLGHLVWVFYPQLLRTLGLRADAVSSLPPAQRRGLGVALGRVVAHELIHSLQPGVPHAPHGLMAAQTTRAWLLSRHLRLDSAFAEELRACSAGR